MSNFDFEFRDLMYFDIFFKNKFEFLLDCGWDEANSTRIIDNLRRHGRQIDAILISHPSVLHLGLLPYAVSQLGTRLYSNGSIA